jgi:hypothetical protein
MGDSENRAAVEGFWAALENEEFDAASEEIDQEFEEMYP